MDLRTRADSANVRATTDRLLKRMLSPLCGINQHIGFVRHGYRAPRFVVAGAELTGVHVLRGREAPRPGFYHIGGGGIFLEEALIRSLGETLERYAQFVAVAGGHVEVEMRTYREMEEAGRRVPPKEKLQFFTEAQYAHPRFPFRPFQPDHPLGWVQMRSLVDGGDVWVPAQLAVVGYLPDHGQGEDWLIAAVTTGTAAHTTPPRAMLNGLLEIVQIDAAMGHWYSSRHARRIASGPRTTPIEALIRDHFDPGESQPAFYHLPSADLPGIVVACVVERERGIPSVGVGLGAGFELVDAMYKALIEAVGTMELARWQIIELGAEAARAVDPDVIFNLDESLVYYANPARRPIIEDKFRRDDVVSADDLPADGPHEVGEQVDTLIRGFGETGKDVCYLDLSTRDVTDLGFHVARTWSADTVSLPLPSAPPIAHRRFDAYGGGRMDAPHPYP